MPASFESPEDVPAVSQMAHNVPLLDLKAQFAPLRENVLEVIARVCDAQQFILGAEVDALERELETFLEIPHAIGVSSGTDALLAALMALDIRPGDEVVTTPFSFFATAGSIARAGARPVFVDIDPATFNIDASAIKTSFGGQLSVDLVAGYFAPFTASVGAAWGHDGSGLVSDRVTVFFHIGRAF